MQKLGSIFLDDFVIEDKVVLFDFTLRQIVLVVGFVVSIILVGILFFLGYPDVLVYIIGAIPLLPTIFYGLKLTQRLQLKERWRFIVLIAERHYQTEVTPVKEYSTSDFIQEKTVRETDPI
ncbi:TPA: hypothetical protein U1B12_001070 [Streptococcus suis]|uniref:hypothetical protein n=1 Tax=Streptococcus suis TaxID=1307 RepID=UPI00209B696A|nr:hypothetical protein [Streptococcus suis]MCO8200848.1 hypothetical protein [Streptococcus suis]MCO8218385.1 hypothetical protein [Streptococcus suis]HEM3467935.1 hypothetical protein [Streptococcus suis]HEM3478646.1 hypothetical protein [Streptococcus suis]